MHRKDYSIFGASGTRDWTAFAFRVQLLCVYVLTASEKKIEKKTPTHKQKPQKPTKTHHQKTTALYHVFPPTDLNVCCSK